MKRIGRHLSYANVTGTLALLIALGGSGAYAIDKIGSHDIANNSIKSVDLKNRKAVKGVDVKRNGLTGRQIDETSLDAQSFAPVAGHEAGDCNPASSSAFTQCVKTTIHTKERSRVLAVATGNEDSIGIPARAICELRIDSHAEAFPVQPGEEVTDNTSGSATNGFARTVVSEPIPAGRHAVALACEESAGDVRIDVPTIAAIAIGSR